MMNIREEEEDDKTIENERNEAFIKEIRKKVKAMKKSKYRTSNFSLIEYFVDNDFQPLNKNYLILNLIQDYNSNPKRYVLAKKRGIFKSEKSFKQSIMHYVQHNNSFEVGPGEGELSINLENACLYLRSVYTQYITNSPNVKTPIKFNSKNTINIKKEKEFQNYNIKKEKIDEDVDFDIVFSNNKKPSFSQKIKNENNKFDKFIKNPKEKESFGSNSVISLTDSSASTVINVEKNELFNDKDKAIPHIFLKRMIQKDKLIFSLDKNSFYKMENSMEKYLTNTAKDENSEEIEEKLLKIYNSLQKLTRDKESYIILCNDLNTLRKEIFQVWKLMSSQLLAVNLSVKIKSYSYDMYANLRDAIFKSEKVYKEISSNIKKILNDLTEKVNLFEDERNKIIKALASIKNLLSDDKDFTMISNLIEKKLGIDFNNYYQSDKDETLEEDEDSYENSKNDNTIIQDIRSYRDERKKIMDEIDKIDKNIGNITID